jgi:CRP/FNR family transcriptional regulator
MQKRDSRVINIASIRVACKDCTLHELCLPAGLAGSDLDELDKAVRRRRTLKKGDALYRFGDPLRALYAIRHGSIKTIGLMEDGRAQVTGFFLPGELLGIDAINADTHPCSAEALETTEVCEIPFQSLEQLAAHIPGLQHQLFRIMSREIVREEQMLMMLGRMTAEERLASCLLSFLRRHNRLGKEGSELRLSMSRQDIGDYLGIALETVSRLFSRFQEEGIIEAQARQVRVLDPARLEALAGSHEREQESRRHPA